MEVKKISKIETLSNSNSGKFNAAVKIGKFLSEKGFNVNYVDANINPVINRVMIKSVPGINYSPFGEVVVENVFAYNHVLVTFPNGQIAQLIVQNSFDLESKGEKLHFYEVLVKKITSVPMRGENLTKLIESGKDFETLSGDKIKISEKEAENPKEFILVQEVSNKYEFTGSFMSKNGKKFPASATTLKCTFNFLTLEEIAKGLLALEKGDFSGLQAQACHSEHLGELLVSKFIRGNEGKITPQGEITIKISEEKRVYKPFKKYVSKETLADTPAGEALKTFKAAPAAPAIVNLDTLETTEVPKKQKKTQKLPKEVKR